jgi:hypothetical protein
MILTSQQLVRNFKIPIVYMSIRNLIRATELLSFYLHFKVPTAINNRGEAINKVNVFLPRLDENVNVVIANHDYLHFRAFLATKRKQMIHSLIMAITVTYMFQLPSQGHVLAKRAFADFRSIFVEEIVRQWSVWYKLNTIKGLMSFQDLSNEWLNVHKMSLEHLWTYAHIP